MRNVPFKWTDMTPSQSSSVMLISMRSRRMPALLTTTSRDPKAASASSITCCAPLPLDTSSPLAPAAPPIDRISSTTSPAGPVEPPVPSTSAPRSLTITFAPCLANSMAWPRPMPRPAPVTTTTRPSQIPDMCLLRLIAFIPLRLLRGRLEHREAPPVRELLPADLHGHAGPCRVGLAADDVAHHPDPFVEVDECDHVRRAIRHLRHGGAVLDAGGMDRATS